MWRRVCLFSILVLWFLSFPEVANSSQSTNYISKETIDLGGGEVKSGKYILGYSPGEPVIGPAKSSHYSTNLGYYPTVVPPNLPPVADAGADTTVSINTLVTLDGSKSSDPDDGDILTYIWLQTAGHEVTLSDSTAVQPTFTPTQTDTYTFQLVVNDGRANSAPDSVTIIVTQDSVPITITTSPSERQITVDSTNTALQIFNWTPGSSHTIGVSSPQSGGSGIQYAFSSWSDGEAQTHAITTPSSATTYTAYFTTQYQLTTSVHLSGAGSVSPDCSEGCWYDSGSSVPLTATPNDSYTFSSWSGSISSDSNPVAITMDNPKTVETRYKSVPDSPSAPINLKADGDNPSPWKNTRAFIIDWTNPESTSGIKGAWYKLATAPTSDTDGIFTPDKPFNVEASAENGQVLYVWLEDNAGNKDYNNSRAVELRYETTPPVAPISLTADEANPSPWKNTPFSIDWENPDDTSEIKGAWYKLGSAATSDTDGAFTTNKPFDVTATAENGQVLYVWLEDNAGNKDHNNSETVSLQYETTSPAAPIDLTADGENPSP
ncbi:MAG: PKD domain-containing protein [bacterium]|nr:PKD domain-containing protein [bacterium]